jgi:hypothetical protein
MVVGFNHNFRYRGEVYHIQTEDSGMSSPNIVTLLYQGGTILASKKTSYADIAKVDNLEQVVEELMKEQHKNMLRGLKSGEFDEVIKRFKAGKKITPQRSHAATVSDQSQVEEPIPQGSTAVPPRPIDAPAASPPGQNQETVFGKTSSPAQKQNPAPAIEVSLDDEILSYLIGEEK